MTEMAESEEQKTSSIYGKENDTISHAAIDSELSPNSKFFE